MSSFLSPPHVWGSCVLGSRAYLLVLAWNQWAPGAPGRTKHFNPPSEHSYTPPPASSLALLLRWLSIGGNRHHWDTFHHSWVPLEITLSGYLCSPRNDTSFPVPYSRVSWLYGYPRLVSRDLPHTWCSGFPPYTCLHLWPSHCRGGGDPRRPLLPHCASSHGGNLPVGVFLRHKLSVWAPTHLRLLIPALRPPPRPVHLIMSTSRASHQHWFVPSAARSQHRRSPRVPRTASHMWSCRMVLAALLWCHS